MSGAPEGIAPALLVTGGGGQLASAIEGAAAGSPWRVLRVGRPAFDFDRPETLAAAFRRARPAAVVNAAAWTAVDAAESDPAGARRANRDGPAALADLCAAAGIPLIHVSTDYVFDGDKGEPYLEEDPVNPTGVYGLTKLEGEREVLARCPKAVVLRTSWVYSHAGKNFLRAMLAASRESDRLRVVCDQKGCPTSAEDLARAALHAAARAAGGWREGHRGVFHAAGTGWTTWHGFARAIFEGAAARGHPAPEVVPIASADWPTPVRRPADSRLDCSKFERVFGWRLPPWQSGLDRALSRALAAP